MKHLERDRRIIFQWWWSRLKHRQRRHHRHHLQHPPHLQQQERRNKVVNTCHFTVCFLPFSLQTFTCFLPASFFYIIYFSIADISVSFLLLFNVLSLVDFVLPLL